MAKPAFWKRRLRDGFLVGTAASLTISSAIFTKKITEANAAYLKDWRSQPDAEVNEAAKKTYQEWLQSVEELRDLPLQKKVKIINAKVNALMTYANDIDLYGGKEYWAQAALSVYHRKGDCEDYAILKYETLRYLGVSDDICAVLKVSVKKPDGTISHHALTMVDMSKEKEYLSFLLLDNSGPPFDMRDMAQRSYVPRYVHNRSTSHPYPSP